MPLTRRSFIGQAAGIVGSAAWFPAVHLRSQRPDIVIRRATIFDGTGADPRDGDVVISGDRIVSVGGRAAAVGLLELDAPGSAVAPGFVDIHSHADGSLLGDPRAESVVRQGVTTVVVGQDGSSRIPGDGAPAGSQTLSALLAAVAESQSSVNLATMVGLGTVRGQVLGGATRAPNDSELARMVQLVERALADGACGASSGLEYTPGAYASTAELIALCRPLARLGLPYATHMRNEDDRVLESIDESIAVAAGAGCPLHVSHLKTQGPRNWSKLASIFERFAEVRSSGVDVTFDRYPYVAYATGITNLFPLWSREGGTAGLVARFANPEASARVREETLAKVAMIGGWNNVQITGGVSDAALRDVVGARLGDFAAARGMDPYELTRRIVETSGNPGMVGFAMSEENLDQLLASRYAMVCSDGGAYSVDAQRGSPHPRGLGSFPRVLGRYVRERRALTLQDAVHKMTGAPAARLRLAERGRLAPGCFADAVIFDPSTIADRATFEDPYQYPVGISAVIVNGLPALRDGMRTALRGGRGLRPS